MRGILTYHSIDPSGSPISLAEPQFRGHVAMFGSRQIEPVPLEWITKVKDERESAALTFDDGFANFAEAAWPLLKHHDVPVTLFVTTERRGGDNRWGEREQKGIPTLPLLGWDAIARMVDKGLLIGSHGRTHRRLTKLSDAELQEELAGSADEIERRLGVRPKTFCYPYGDVDERVARAAGEVYELACTTELRPLGPQEDPLRLPRLDAHYLRDPRLLKGWGGAGFRRRLGLRRAGRKLRALIGGG
jgi:peptidoglycan/xylan/chitin deacetylase (PgdA/CDA1 family)